MLQSKSTSTKKKKPVKRQHGHTAQSDLLSYLKPAQRRRLRTLLRPLNDAAREALCVSLLDYMESGLPAAPPQPLLAVLFRRLTDEAQGQPAVRPLRAVNSL